MKKIVGYIVGASIITMPLFGAREVVQQKPAVNSQAASAAPLVKRDQPATPAIQKSPDAKPKAALYPIDRIEVVMYGKESTEIITLSDINRIGFDGQSRSKDEVIVERLMFQDALRHKIVIDEKMIDDYIAKMCKQFNATMDDIKLMFEKAGYSFEEGRKQFGIMYGVNQMINHKIKERLIVPEKDVVAYYEAHPLIKPATYVVERAVVTFTKGKENEVRKKIDTLRATGKGLVVGWRQFPEIVETDLADDKKFITTLKVGEISEPRELDGGFELFRLKSKQDEHLVPLESRYRDIVDILQRPKFEELLSQYKNELLRTASMVSF